MKKHIANCKVLSYSFFFFLNPDLTVWDVPGHMKPNKQLSKQDNLEEFSLFCRSEPVPGELSCFSQLQIHLGNPFTNLCHSFLLRKTSLKSDLISSASPRDVCRPRDSLGLEGEERFQCSKPLASPAGGRGDPECCNRWERNLEIWEHKATLPAAHWGSGDMLLQTTNRWHKMVQQSGGGGC